jgi:cytochrome c oxidase cbb3-type subunit 2
MLDHGKEVWEQAKCWECHGQTGKGDGEKAAGLKDDLGFTVVPADLTSGQFKSGPRVEDIFRTISTGLSGTPMPTYRDSLSEDDRWALSYYILALSAFKNPLTKQPLQIADTTRAALNDLNLKADTPEDAYVPKELAPQKAGAAGAGEAATKGD